MENTNNQRGAFIAIVGRPNVGKSSTLNCLIGQKLAIVSKKPQTTRTRIMGVLTQDIHQIVFIDTPGLIKPKNSLGEYMVKTINQSVAGVDACMLVTQADSKISQADLEFIEKFKKLKMPVVLVINKIDLVSDKTKIMEQIIEYQKLYDFEAVVPICAKNGDAIDSLKSELKKLTIEGDHFFSSDTLTDQPERVIASEIIREKILRILQKEIPHGVAVVTEKMKERGAVTDIEATIYCEKASHKGIIIGKSGQTLKEILSKARVDMENFFDCKINLQAWVKVKEDWRQRPQILHSFGFDKNDLQ